MHQAIARRNQSPRHQGSSRRYLVFRGKDHVDDAAGIFMFRNVVEFLERFTICADQRSVHRARR